MSVIVARYGIPRNEKAEAGQMVVTYPVLGAVPRRLLEGSAEHHEEPSIEGRLDFLDHAEASVELSDAWKSDPQALAAVEVLRGARPGVRRYREVRQRRIICDCGSNGMRPLLRLYVQSAGASSSAGPALWVVSSGHRVGNAETGALRVPPLAEQVPRRSGRVHVTNFVAACDRCKRGLFVAPSIGQVELTPLDTPTYGIIRD